MAAPRCARPFLGPAKRIKVQFCPSTISPKAQWLTALQISIPRPTIQTISRSKSSDAKNEDKSEKDKGSSRVLDESATLEERLEDIGMDPLEYRQLWNSQQRAKADFEKWQPTTAEEAKQRWKELQETPDHNNMLDMYRRLGVEPIKLAKERNLKLPNDKEPLDPKTEQALDELRTPLNVQAINLRPLRRSPEHGIPVCDLQLRTYSIRNLLLFADFAVRAAYYMGLPARGPIPLPRITERWTVPRANFVFKKSQENFERITMRRLIQIQDGHPETVKAWLAFLHKHQYHGVGMKANIWEYESLESATNVGVEVKEGEFEGRREKAVLDKVEEILGRSGFKEAMKDFKSPVEQRA